MIEGPDGKILDLSGGRLQQSLDPQCGGRQPRRVETVHFLWASPSNVAENGTAEEMLPRANILEVNLDGYMPFACSPQGCVIQLEWIGEPVTGKLWTVVNQALRTG